MDSHGTDPNAIWKIKEQYYNDVHLWHEKCTEEKGLRDRSQQLFKIAKQQAAEISEI